MLEYINRRLFSLVKLNFFFEENLTAMLGFFL